MHHDRKSTRRSASRSDDVDGAAMGGTSVGTYCHWNVTLTLLCKPNSNGICSIGLTVTSDQHEAVAAAIVVRGNCEDPVMFFWHVSVRPQRGSGRNDLRVSKFDASAGLKHPKRGLDRRSYQL